MQRCFADRKLLINGLFKGTAQQSRTDSFYFFTVIFLSSNQCLCACIRTRPKALTLEECLHQVRRKELKSYHGGERGF